MKKKLKNSLVILFLLGIGFSFGQTTTIDFETVDDGYTPSTAFGSGFTDVFNRTNPNIGGNSTFMWSVEDLPATNPSIDLTQISTSGSSSFTFAIDMIAHHFNDWDASDELLITYSTDGGSSYQNLMWVQSIPDDNTTNSYAALDIDFDGDGECGFQLPSLTVGNNSNVPCEVVNNQFETFTSASIDIIGSSTLDIKLQFNGLTSGDEGIYLDNIVITQSGSSTPTVGFDTTTNSIIEADSGTNSFIAPITMNVAPTTDVTINVTLNDGTATLADNDYSGPASNDLTFTTGATYPLTLNADFNVIGDTTIETDENFTLDFTITSGTANTSTTTHTVTITNDDSYNNCFTDNNDFETVEVATNSENDVWTYNAGSNAYTMNGFNNFGSELSNQWLILGDLDLSTYNGSELLQLVLDATEIFDGTDLTVYYTTSYAGCPDDASNNWIQLGLITTDGVAQTIDLSAAAGETSVYIGVEYVDNDGSYSQWTLSNIIIETDNPICFTINSPVISNCVILPTVGFNSATSSITEGDTGTTTHNIAVTMNNVPSANTSVDVISSANTATEGTDYDGVASTITFLTTDTYPMTIQVPVTINGDTDIETNEDFDLMIGLALGSETLANLGTDTHNVTIINDDIAPMLPCSQLIISEYGEPSSGNGKYIEIYNPTAIAIDLANYQLWKVTNGGTWPETTYGLTGSIGSFSTYVIANNSTNVPVADVYTGSSIMQFSGDDAMGLSYNGGAGSVYNLIDVVGTDGPDPGAGWDVAGITNGTKDHTLIRKSSVQIPNTDWATSAGTNTINSEWTVIDYSLSNLNNHISLCQLCNSGTTEYVSGAWTNGAPTNTIHAIINDAYTLNLNIDACACTVNANKSLTIQTGNYLNVQNDIINNGTITVNNTGSLVQVNDTAIVTGSGTFNTEIITTVLEDADRFTYFSSPTNAGDIGLFSGFATDMWEHNDSIQDWSYLGDGTATGAMNVGQGYAIRGGTNATETIDFSGPFNNGIITRPLFFDVYNNVTGDFINSGATDDDSNFVGNPYPSAISADDLITANAIGAVYIWTHESAVVGSAFADNDYIECAIGTCTDLNNGFGGNTPSAYSGFIASGQGFFVTALSAGTLTFNNAMRSTTNNDEFRSTDNQKLWLNMTTVQGYGKQIALTFTENGTANFDAKYEAVAFGNNYGLGFYSLNTENDKLSINDTGILENDRTIPLGFYINAPIVDGATISIGRSENLEDTNVYLIDNLLNVTHDLKRSDYQIAITETGEINDRFEIVFNRDPLSTNDDIIANDTLVVSNQNDTQIKVNMLDGSIITNFKAFDVLGKLVINMKPNKNSFVIDTNFNQGQVLFIKATLENGQVLSNKFLKL